MENGVRLNRYLALCGVGARRKVEDVISGGRVRVDGKVVLLPSYRVAAGMTVLVDGRQVEPQEMKYLVMNKPAGRVCSVSDRFDPTVLELLPGEYGRFRLFPVGRLDRESEGLLILTNDGGFAQEVMHPSRRILKEYEVLLDREISRREVRGWMAGVESEGRPLRPVNVLVMEGKDPPGRWVSVVLAEGVKREIRHMAAGLGFEVRALFRRRVGKMELRYLKPGEWADLPRAFIWKAIRSGGMV